MRTHPWLGRHVRATLQRWMLRSGWPEGTGGDGQSARIGPNAQQPHVDLCPRTHVPGEIRTCDTRLTKSLRRVQPRSTTAPTGVSPRTRPGPSRRVRSPGTSANSVVMSKELSDRTIEGSSLHGHGTGRWEARCGFQLRHSPLGRESHRWAVHADVVMPTPCSGQQLSTISRRRTGSSVKAQDAGEVSTRPAIRTSHLLDLGACLAIVGRETRWLLAS